MTRLESQPSFTSPQHGLGNRTLSGNTDISLLSSSSLKIKRARSLCPVTTAVWPQETVWLPDYSACWGLAALPSTCWSPGSSGRRSHRPWWLAVGWGWGESFLGHMKFLISQIYAWRSPIFGTLLMSLCLSRLTISSMISPSPRTNLDENTGDFF